MKFIWRWPIRAYRKGQALAEYSIIVAIIAIASIAVVTVFGRQIREIFFGGAQQLAGDSDAEAGDQTTGQQGTINTGLGDWSGSGN